MNYKAYKLLIERFIDYGLSPEIGALNGDYYDEPKFFSCTTNFKINHKYTDALTRNFDVSGGSGFSFNTPEEALFKSLCEAMERFCYFCYRKKNIKYQKYKNNKQFIDPSIFSTKKNVNDYKYGWVKAVNAVNYEKCYIPAQLIYLRYKLVKKELLLDFPRNSNGGALGSSHEQALVNGIYEIIERDAFMTIYLNRITPKRIDLALQKNKIIDMVLEKCKRYKLEICVLDVTHDLLVPSFISIIIDRTRLGPSVIIGAKSGLNTQKAIVGAIEESFMVRQTIRRMLKEGYIYGESKKKKDNIFAERAAYWFPKEKIKEIRFLLSGKISDAKYTDFTGTKKQELSYVLNNLKKHKKEVYYSDFTINEFKKLGFFAYKVIIPNLHPMYLREEEKDRAINKRRLEEVAKFFGNKYRGVNPIQHPFM